MGGGRSDLGGGGKYTDFGSYGAALMKSTRFFDENSNVGQWRMSLSSDEYHAISYYTGIGYSSINKAMYTQDYEDMDSSMQQTVDSMQTGMDKFVLTKGIQCTRQCDFQIFGAKKYESMTKEQVIDYIKNNADSDGTLQNDGFLSFGANNHGAAIAGSGLVLHAKVPPSVGAGAYVNPISQHSGSSENEFLFNAYSRFKFDLSSIRVDSSGKIHINCTWKGRGTNKSKKKK